MPDLVDLFRILNLLIAIVVLLWLVFRRVKHRAWYRRGSLRKDIWVMAFCWDLALIVGSIEQLINSDTYLRVFIAMAAILTTLAILLRPPDDWLGEAVDPPDPSR